MLRLEQVCPILMRPPQTLAPTASGSLSAPRSAALRIAMARIDDGSKPRRTALSDGAGGGGGSTTGCAGGGGGRVRLRRESAPCTGLSVMLPGPPSFPPAPQGQHNPWSVQVVPSGRQMAQALSSIMTVLLVADFYRVNLCGF